jgi:hypothetical protein
VDVPRMIEDDEGQAFKRRREKRAHS